MCSDVVEHWDVGAPGVRALRSHSWVCVGKENKENGVTGVVCLVGSISGGVTSGGGVDWLPGGRWSVIGSFGEGLVLGLVIREWMLVEGDLMKLSVFLVVVSVVLMLEFAVISWSAVVLVESLMAPSRSSIFSRRLSIVFRV